MCLQVPRDQVSGTREQLRQYIKQGKVVGKDGKPVTDPAKADDMVRGNKDTEAALRHKHDPQSKQRKKIEREKAKFEDEWRRKPPAYDSVCTRAGQALRAGAAGAAFALVLGVSARMAQGESFAEALKASGIGAVHAFGATFSAHFVATGRLGAALGNFFQVPLCKVAQCMAAQCMAAGALAMAVQGAGSGIDALAGNRSAGQAFCDVAETGAQALVGATAFAGSTAAVTSLCAAASLAAGPPGWLLMGVGAASGMGASWLFNKCCGQHLASVCTKLFGQYDGAFQAEVANEAMTKLPDEVHKLSEQEAAAAAQAVTHRRFRRTLLKHKQDKERAVQVCTEMLHSLGSQVFRH